jgi:hypothetical protein
MNPLSSAGTRLIIRGQDIPLATPNLILLGCQATQTPADEFTQLMNQGKSHYENGDSVKVTRFTKGPAWVRTIDVHLNFQCLFAGESEHKRVRKLKKC